MPPRIVLFSLLVNLIEATLINNHIPECAKDGVHVGAGLGALAGGGAGAALISQLGLTSMSMATCPTMAMTTLAGTGAGLMGGPLLPIGGLLAGAMLGGVAGGTTGGIFSCQAAQSRYSEPYYIKYSPHSDG